MSDFWKNAEVVSIASQALFEAMSLYEKKLGRAPTDGEGLAFMAALTAVCMSGPILTIVEEDPEAVDRWLALVAKLTIELVGLDDGPKTRITIIRE